MDDSRNQVMTGDYPRIARALNVVGLMNVQYATKDDVVYVLEVNPRASRTVPYLSKATGKKKVGLKKNVKKKS